MSHFNIVKCIMFASGEIVSPKTEVGMTRLVSLVAVVSVLVLVAGCTMFNWGSSGGVNDAIVVTDYYIVSPGKAVGLTASTNAAVVAEINVHLDQIDKVPDSISGLIPNVKSYLVVGAVKDAVTAVSSMNALSTKGDGPVTLGEIYVVPAGQPIDLSAGTGTPALVLGVSVDLTKIDKVPEEVSSLVPGLNSYLLLGATRNVTTNAVK
jgi:hypothetical protein